ncbi:MAG: hypothetical protein IID60_09355 [Proteobacteria bacterium]|nr:hypothetical protein [Pseudomonadota bacterium]
MQFLLTRLQFNCAFTLLSPFLFLFFLSGLGFPQAFEMAFNVLKIASTLKILIFQCPPDQQVAGNSHWNASQEERTKNFSHHDIQA